MTVTTDAPRKEPDAGRTRNYDPRTQKRCIKCHEWKDRSGENRGFGDHESSSDGLQSICFSCKNKANNVAREKNVMVRLRHHISTRCLTQLGEAAPEGFTRDMERYLGYRVSWLVKYLSWELKRREGPRRKLRDALMEGYHVDHIHPLSRFAVLRDDGTVDWAEFRRCWHPRNLSAIPGEENLKKGAKVKD